MKIAGYLPLSLLDWPGKMTTVVFTAGCNFRCPFCHNRDLVVVNKGLKLLDEEEILKKILEKNGWLDGVVVTGGEPTLQPDLKSFLGKIKKMGLDVKLDTNGSRPEVVGELIASKYVDFVAMDYKTVFEDYERKIFPPEADFTMLSNFQKIFNLLNNKKIELEVRTTVVPGIHTTQILKEMGEALDKFSKKRKKIVWCWQKFVGRNCWDKSLNGREGFGKKEIGKMKKEAERGGLEIKLRGW